jgi:response regulator RpfG family c-di-GMP phosphodiesterase
MTDAPGTPRILCVDDEPNVLEGLERTLFEQFDIVTAASGAAGLDVLRSEGPFAVVVSDMQMPEMDGATFLAQVRNLVPDTVRVLLTGQAAIDAAIAAVNEGNIFRFLCKPCPQDVLVTSLQAAVEQYRLVTAERELLENTLKGSVKVLTEVLSLGAPIAFSRAGAVKSYVAHIVERLGLPNRWTYELAAMLSQIGCIALPPETLERAYAGQGLSEDEQQMLDAHPETGYKLLASIPRLETVAEMIKHQNDPVGDSSGEDEIQLGARLLRVALDVDRLVAGGVSVSVAVGKLQQGQGYEPKLLAALSDFQGYERSTVVKMIGVKELSPYMMLDEDIFTKDGNLVVRKGREVNTALIERLKNFAQGIGITEPIRVRIAS